MNCMWLSLGDTCWRTKYKRNRTARLPGCLPLSAGMGILPTASIAVTRTTPTVPKVLSSLWLRVSPNHDDLGLSQATLVPAKDLPLSVVSHAIQSLVRVSDNSAPPHACADKTEHGESQCRNAR